MSLSYSAVALRWCSVLGLSGGFVWACAQPVTEPGYDIPGSTDGLGDGGSGGTGAGIGSETVGSTALSSATTTSTTGGMDATANVTSGDTGEAATTVTVTTSSATASTVSSDTATSTTSGGAGGATSGESATVDGSTMTVGGSMTTGGGGTTTGGGSTTTGGGSTTTGGGTACGDPAAGEQICDFSEWSGTSSGNWTGDNGMRGGWFTYAGTGSSISVTHNAAGSLRLSGTVNSYAGFGMSFEACTDASAYSGVAFNIGGVIGSMGQAVLQARTSSNLATSSGGECSASCKNNESEYTVPSSSGTVTVSWARLTGGTPVSPADPGDLMGFQWQFHCPTDGACALDVTLDNLRFAD